MKFGELIRRELDLSPPPPPPPGIADLTTEEIEKRITQNRVILPELIGSLYPGILLDEIEKLQEEYKKRTGEELPLPDRS